MEKKSSYLKSPDLLPIGHSRRKIGTLGFALMWIGMAVVLAAFAIGGAGVQNLSLGWVILATIIGSVAIGLCMTITGDIGIEHGLSFPVYMRAPFGTIGTHIPSIIRGLTASFWFGINTFFGATAMNAILFTLTGFNNWFVCFLIFAAVQVLNTAFGIKAVERFADLAAPIIIIISAWMYTTLSERALEQGRDVWAWIESPVTGGAAITAFLVVIFSNMGFWATLAADMPSISRFIKAPKYESSWLRRNKSSIIGSVIALPLTQTFMVAIGGVSYIAVSNYDPVVALQEAASGIVLGVLLLMIIFAQWSTNAAANLIPAATIFSNVGGPKVPFWAGVVIAGIVGSVVQPWNLFDILIQVLLIVGGILSAIVGILFADYYLLRKRRVNVHDLYEDNGQYKYSKGFNLAGFIAWFAGGLASYFLANYSFIVGFVVGAVLYYLLAKYWYFRKHEQAEIMDPDDEKYLGITVGRDWDIKEVADYYEKPKELTS
ncbi:NCS1 family transporter [Sutcliffiella rhizosphaerae]|uniref:Hydantoin permease n=1 Tax=Sutcliffiella rhizosphaerae TaxID=2880967 RepID=A0ABM8YHT9_9BACI|nr:NCS1 family transporter [Sutcliffiella rhizosphaerae]CAG9619435.1 Hydantoin permease [Sutcliffiella rhizosphaerae]